MIPSNIWHPELSSVGITEQAARKQHREVLVGRARFEEVSRGQINGIKDGLLKDHL